jgi:RNA polymerase sigma-70 factor (ECF subfamily)
MFSTWLTRIALHDALARARRRARFASEDTAGNEGGDPMIALKSPGPDPERQAFAGELRTLIEAAIDSLPDHYRAVFVMRAVEGMSTAESAECLDITEETAKTRLRRARLMLRDALYKRAGIESAAAFSFEAPRCDRIVTAVLEEIEVIEARADNS